MCLFNTDLRDDLSDGNPSACCEVLRRLVSCSSEVLDQCSTLGMDPGYCHDRKVVVVVMELLREFASGEVRAVTLSVDQFLKPSLFLKKKYGLITSFSKYVKKQIDRFAPVEKFQEEEPRVQKNQKQTKKVSLVDTLTHSVVDCEDRDVSGDLRAEDLAVESGDGHLEVGTTASTTRAVITEKNQEEMVEQPKITSKMCDEVAKENAAPVDESHMKVMEKHFHDTQSMMRMMLSLSKRIRSLEDIEPSSFDISSTPLNHSTTSATTGKKPPLKDQHASKSSMRSPDRNGSISTNKSKFKQKCLSNLLMEETKQHMGSANETSGEENSGEGEDALGTAYIDLLFSLMEKKMQASLHSTIKKEIVSAITTSDEVRSQQMHMLTTEIDKIHSDFDRRISKLETMLAHDKAERNIEEQELSKLIANSTFSPAGNLARFRLNAALLEGRFDK